jgi:hypothetical protein
MVGVELLGYGACWPYSVCPQLSQVVVINAKEMSNVVQNDLSNVLLLPQKRRASYAQP